MSQVERNVRTLVSPSSTFEERFVPDLEELKVLVKNFQDAGYRVVLTQGVYDLIHEGHAKYLDLAKQQGDILIVGVDSDKLTRSRKGPNRPVVPEDERLRMLSFLRPVDIITLRTLGEHTSNIDYLHEALRPDVFVMSVTTKDFPAEKRTAIEKFVGKVEIFPPQAETSSTARIRLLMVDGAAELGKKVSETVRTFLETLGGDKT